MKTLMKILTAICLAVTFFGMCCLDTEGTCFFYILTAGGMTGLLLLIGLYWRDLR